MTDNNASEPANPPSNADPEAMTAGAASDVSSAAAETAAVEGTVVEASVVDETAVEEVVEEPVVAAPRTPDPVAVITTERDKIKDQLLRTLADFDNFRKRSIRDKQDEYRKGKEDVLRDLLPVFDNLERASNYARTGADGKAVADGVQMVLRLFDDTLIRLGGIRLKTLGQPFDPNLHEAIQQVESAEHPAGTVAQELVAGYQLGDRLLRPAMVAVSKGAPAAPPPEVQN